MKVTFWGVRGSIPSPGPHTVRYGGNTSCVSIEIDDRILVIDAGTGIRMLGAELAGSTREVFILLTHLHSDHIQGFPFFAPLYRSDQVTYVLDHIYRGRTWSLLQQLDGRHFPIRSRELSGTCRQISSDPVDYLRTRGFDITRQWVNHPGGACGYRIAHQGAVFVHIPDNELKSADAPDEAYDAVVSFCRGADVLSHDAQFVSSDLPAKAGWGHSQIDHTRELASAAGVRHLVLFHHDPARTDDEIDALQEEARTFLSVQGIQCTAAYEGLTMVLNQQVASVAKEA